MKILIITQGVSRIVLPLVMSKHTVVGIVESASRNHSDSKAQNIKNVLVILYARLKGKDVSLKNFCFEKKIPYNFFHKSDASKVSEWIRALEPELIVVFSMSQLLKREVFGIPKYGTINLHPSYLPEYRGPNPDFWQYINMEMCPGVTIHYIDDGEDTGNIINQERLAIELGTKSPERLDRLIGGLGVSLLLKSISEIEQGVASNIEQPKESSTFRARNISPEEHGKIIDWNSWSIEKIWHVLRGTELWLNALPQPTGIYKWQRWTIGDFEKLGGQVAPLGSLTTYRNKKCVATKDGCIYITIKFDIKKTAIGLIRSIGFIK